MSLQKDVEAKEKLKYEQQREKEQELRNWMGSTLPAHADRLTDFSLSLHEVLKDGVILCELIVSIIASKEEGHEWSKIKKPRIHPAAQGGGDLTEMAKFKERENISNYLSLCKKIGLSENLCFETTDLYEAKGLSFVINNIALVHRISLKKFDPQVSGSASPGPQRRAGLASPAVQRRPNRQQPTPTRAGSSSQLDLKVRETEDEEDEDEDDDFVPSDGGFLDGDDDDEDDFVPSDGGFLDDDVDDDDEDRAPKADQKAAMNRSFAGRAQPAPSVPSLDDDMKTKAAFSYNSDQEAAVREWIEAVLKDKVFPSNVRFADSLKSGVILCRLVNALKPGSVAKINESKIAFKHIENIGNYIKASSALGLPRSDSFDVPDLFDEKNMTHVVEQIARLARYVNNVLKLSDVPIIAKTKTRDLWASSLVESAEAGGLTPSAVALAEMTMEQLELVRWMNDILETHDPEAQIENVVEIRNGLPLLKLLEALSGGAGTVGGYVHTPTTTWHFMQNVSQAFRFLSSQFFERIVNCTESDIVMGKPEACGALLKYTRRKYDREYDVKSDVLSSCLAEMGGAGRTEDDEFIQTVLHGLDLQDEEGMLVNLEKYLGGLSGEAASEESEA